MAPRGGEHTGRRTRTSGVWTGVLAAVVLLLILLIFILENTQRVKVSFFGADGHIPLGVALLLAAVGGGLVVGIAGVARIVQLRTRARRAHRGTASP
jgi:lipopolysaccharide assembly protein A